MTSLSYPLVAIGVSDTNNFSYSLVAPPPGVSVHHTTAFGVDKWELLIDSDIFTTVGDTTLTLQITNLAVSPHASAQFPIVMTRNADYTLTTPLIFNEDIAIVVDSSSAANLLEPKSFYLTSNFPIDPMYPVGYSLLSATTLIGATVDNTGLVTFTPTQYGDFYVTAQARIDLDPAHQATKMFKVSVTPSHLYKLVDGQIEFDFTGSDAAVGNRSLTFNVMDSNTPIPATKSIVVPLSVKPSLTGLQVPVSHLRYWTSHDTPTTSGATVSLPLTGSLPNTSPIMGGSATLDNGLVTTVVEESGVKKIKITPPAATSSYTSKNNTYQVIPINLDGYYGAISTTLRTMVINTNSPGLTLDPSSPFPFEVDVYTHTIKLGEDFITLNPLKPYPNAPDITRKSGLKARVKSGQSLPVGLSLNEVTGLIYGKARSPISPTLPVTIEFVETTTLVGSVHIHFDIVNCYLTVNDNKEVPATYRTLIAGTVGGGTLTFGANSITRTDRSWTDEGVKPVSVEIPVAFTTITLSNFPGAGVTTPKTVKVLSVTDTRNPDGSVISSVLTVDGASFTSSSYTPSMGIGRIKTQTFLRSATVNANYLTGSALYSGHIPNGLEVQISGKNVIITGVTSEFGTFDTTILLTDNLGNSSYWVLSRDHGSALEIPFSVPLEISTSTIPLFNSTDALFFQLQARGGAGSGSGPYTWESSPLPSGVTLSSTGVLQCGTGLDGSGFPLTATFIVRDSNELGDIKTLNLTYDNSIKITTSVLPIFSLSPASSQTLTASGGGPPYHWGYAVGSVTLPTEFSLLSNGTITYDGSLVSSVSVTPTFKVTDTSPSPLSTTKAITVTAQASSVGAFTFTQSLVPIQRGRSYSGYVKVDGGTAPYYWTASGLPLGITGSESVDTLQFNLSGMTSSLATSATPIFTVVDSLNAVLTYTPTIDITSGLFINTTTLPQVRASQAYRYYGDPYALVSGVDIGQVIQMVVDSPVALPTYTITSTPSVSSVFPGITMSSSGEFSGTYSGSVVAPTPITFTATNTVDSTSVTISMRAVTSSLAISTLVISPTPSGTAWSHQLAYTGGSGTGILWGLTDSLPTNYSLPTNIFFDLNTGLLTGNPPIAAGIYPVSFKVTDSTGAISNRGFILSVGASQIAYAGPDYKNGLALGYAGYVSATTPGNPLSISPVSSGAFKVYMIKTVSTAINQMSVQSWDSEIGVSIDNIVESGDINKGRVTTISINNLPIKSLGDHTFGLNIIDSGMVVPLEIKYKSIASRSISVTQVNDSPLLTETIDGTIVLPPIAPILP